VRDDLRNGSSSAGKSVVVVKLIVPRLHKVGESRGFFYHLIE
jgi:hypothetical protein